MERVEGFLLYLFFSISLDSCHADCRLFGTISTQMDKPFIYLLVFYSERENILGQS